MGAAFQRAGQMERLLSPFFETFEPARLNSLREAAILDPIETFLQQRPERRRYAYRYYLKGFFGDLRPASVWEALSVPTEELVEGLMRLDCEDKAWPPPRAREAVDTVTAFLRFCRDLGYLPDDPELNEWLEEEDPSSPDASQVGRSGL
jgi:hypothetical protein